MTTKDEAQDEGAHPITVLSDQQRAPGRARSPLTKQVLRVLSKRSVLELAGRGGRLGRPRQARGRGLAAHAAPPRPAIGKRQRRVPRTPRAANRELAPRWPRKWIKTNTRSQRGSGHSRGGTRTRGKNHGSAHAHG